MIKFLHAADLHLDTPFVGGGAERRQEQRQLLRDLTALANEQSCDAVLLAGDLFDSANAYPETIEALCAALKECSAQVFIAPGNHDCLYRGSPYLTVSWPENVHIFTEPQITAVPLAGRRCRVYGAGFPAPHIDGLLQDFHVEDEAETNLMVLHGDPTSADSPYNAITKDEIAASGLDYLALGHIHLRSGLLREGRTHYAWSGCPMGRGFDETGEKGVYIGTLDGGQCELTFFPLPGRRYEILDVPAGDDPLAAILAALPDDTARDIYRIRLTGEAAPFDRRALKEALSPRFFSLQLIDETLPKVDLWAGAGDDTLRGQFLAELQAAYQTADEPQRRVIALAARLGIDAIEGRDEVIEP